MKLCISNYSPYKDRLIFILKHDYHIYRILEAASLLNLHSQIAITGIRISMLSTIPYDPIEFVNFG